MTGWTPGSGTAATRLCVSGQGREEGTEDATSVAATSISIQARSL